MAAAKGIAASMKCAARISVYFIERKDIFMNNVTKYKYYCLSRLHKIYQEQRYAKRLEKTRKS